MLSPRHFLSEIPNTTTPLPVCDHYSGVEVRMRKSLALQAEMMAEYGVCMFDVTLDCEDGASVGGEIEHAHLVRELVLTSTPTARIGVRLHAITHAAFEHEINVIIQTAGHRLSHIMLPKIECASEIDAACCAINAVGGQSIPIHALVESPKAIDNLREITAHPRLQSVSFGLMDFVSSHHGAIPASAMSGAGQMIHPLVVRAKLEIAATCHALGKTPSHCVVTEFKDTDTLVNVASKAAQAFGYRRMWSIHPDQIKPIIQAFSPTESEIETACQILEAATQAKWGPISFAGVLHDRASYRYFWQIIERAHATGQALPTSMKKFFNNFSQAHGAK